MNYEPHELGGVWAWLDGAAWYGMYHANLPAAVYGRLVGGEPNPELNCRFYGEHSEALADLEQALKDEDGNFVDGGGV